MRIVKVHPAGRLLGGPRGTEVAAHCAP